MIIAARCEFNNSKINRAIEDVIEIRILLLIEGVF